MKGNYSLPTVGGLRINELSEIVPLYEKCKDWAEVSKIYFEENISQSAKRATAGRYFRYLKLIISSWIDEERDAFIKSSFDEKKNFVWLGLCRSYPLIGEFALAVIRENALTGRNDLGLDDFRSFISRLVNAGKMEEPQTSVYSKGRSIVFKMIKEMGYFDGKAIQGTNLPPEFIKMLYSHNPEELKYFPISDQAIKRGLEA